MDKIEYKIGDALDCKDDEQTYIIHVCNNIGGFGSGFAGAVAKKWPVVKQEYLKWANTRKDKYHTYDYIPFELGRIQMVRVTKNITVINMIAQHGIGPDENGKPPIRYDALEKCLKQVTSEAISNTIKTPKIIGPRFGAGLSGGRWLTISSLIEVCMIKDFNLDVTIFDLPNNPIPINE